MQQKTKEVLPASSTVLTAYVHMLLVSGQNNNCY